MDSTIKKDSGFKDIYSNYYPLVFGTIRKKVQNRETSDDLAQEVFMVYYKKMDEIQNVRAWLYQTTRLLVTEYYRKNSSLSNERNIEELFLDATLTFVNGFRDTRIIINEAIESIMDEQKRLIFDLIAVQNYTYPEVSRVLGISQRQVFYRYQIICQEIQKYLETRGIKNVEDLL